jgi:hypothetical protein
MEKQEEAELPIYDFCRHYISKFIDTVGREMTTTA